MVLIKKYAILTRAKDERSIIEWAKYHYKIGFSFIYVYDDDSIKSLDTVFKESDISEKNYMILKFDEITKLRKNTKMHIQKKRIRQLWHNMIFNNIKKHLNQFTYLLFIDVDEFLVIKDKTLDQITEDDLDEYKFKWVFFGSNGHIKLPDNTTKIIPYFIKSANEPVKITKSLTKISEMLKMNRFSASPHHILTSKTHSSNCLCKNVAYMAHLSNQDLYTYLFRKGIGKFNLQFNINHLDETFNKIKETGFNINDYEDNNVLQTLVSYWNKCEKNEINNFDLINK